MRISLVWCQDRYDSELLFGGKIQKMVSVLASMAAARFAIECMSTDEMAARAVKLCPHFDCRVFQLPNRAEAANAFLWREKDATKNAISMAARSFYSHKALDGKSGAEMQEMIFQKGQNFNDYPALFKRGTFVRRVTVERPFTPNELARIHEKHRPEPSQMVTRSDVVTLEMPSFGSVANREAVIFDGADPVTAT
jgi:tRNA(His) guanylyltransferase